MDTPAVVKLEPGGKLTNVWVDGQRKRFSYDKNWGFNVITLGGTGTVVADCRLSDPTGRTNLFALGAGGTYLGCTSLSITGNIVTSYATSHTSKKAGWTDGLSIGCEDATVTGNQIIDATDVGIVVYNAGNATQHSKITENIVVNAGNSAYAYGVDPLYVTQDDRIVYDFTGTEVNYNILWTSTTAHFDIALAVGTRPWFGDGPTAFGNIGRGAQVVGNVTDDPRDTFTFNQLTNVDSAIVVNWMKDAYVHRNGLLVALNDTCRCDPSYYVVANWRKYAPAMVQGYTAENPNVPHADLVACIPHK